MLKVDGLNQYYGGSHILRGLSFEAKAGEVTVVLGRNGVGKTTLLKSLMGVVPVKTGQIALDGSDIGGETPYRRVRRGVG
jgi:urea transport system ATP-binding protein